MAEDTPNVTITVRNSSSATSVHCVEFPELDIVASSFKDAMYGFALKAEDRFPSWGAVEPLELWNVFVFEIPPILTIRLTWSEVAQEYMARFEEVPGVRFVRSMDTLHGAVQIIAEHLPFILQENL